MSYYGISKIYSGSPRDKIKPTRTRVSHNSSNRNRVFISDKRDGFDIFKFIKEFLARVVLQIELTSIMTKQKRSLIVNQGAGFKAQKLMRESVRVHQRKGEK
ncbi:MAG: hypothetical protein E3J23_08475 [Candidatus Stahlbacteria bacterium]|nr:MAG: hypothetical protein E3J23_08475 [Candidatus Stahlbacteria bacterium]